MEAGRQSPPGEEVTKPPLYYNLEDSGESQGMVLTSAGERHRDEGEPGRGDSNEDRWGGNLRKRQWIRANEPERTRERERASALGGRKSRSRKEGSCCATE